MTWLLKKIWMRFLGNSDADIKDVEQSRQTAHDIIGNWQTQILNKTHEIDEINKGTLHRVKQLDKINKDLRSIANDVARARSGTEKEQQEQQKKEKL